MNNGAVCYESDIITPGLNKNRQLNSPTSTNNKNPNQAKDEFKLKKNQQMVRHKKMLQRHQLH